jgi:hypothetical protein
MQTERKRSESVALMREKQHTQATQGGHITAHEQLEREVREGDHSLYVSTMPS